MNLYRIFTFLLLLFFVSCQKATDEVPLSSEKEFVSFRLEKHLNTSLDATVTGEITDYEIRLKIPELADKKKLIATFEYHGKAVFVNSIEHEPEISVNDFSSPFNYLIVAEDGTEKVYSVVVQWIDELKSALPHIFIDIDNNENITSKTDYVNRREG